MRRLSSRGTNTLIHGFRSSTWMSSDAMRERQGSKEEGFGGKAQMSKSEAGKRYRERHMRLGLCINCSRKAKTGLLYCRVCLVRTREQWMARHPLFCAECRKLVKPEERRRGNRFHKLCGQKRRARYSQQHRLAASPIREDTESWAYAAVARKRRLRVRYAGSTTECIKLRAKYRWVN